jgi:hypothetical protein
MAATKTKAKARPRAAGVNGQLGGRQLAILLRKADSAKSPEQKKRWRRRFLRGFYGDSRADAYA